MTVRISTGLRNAVAAGYSWRQALANGRLQWYSGSQPTSADDAINGTLLCTFTEASGTFTAETQATFSVQLTGGASGSIDTLEVGGAIPLIGAAVPFNTTLNQTAADLAAAINDYMSVPEFTATASTDTVTVSAPWSLGANANSLTWAITVTTITTDAGSGAFASGVTAINGLEFDYPIVSGILPKTSDIWSGSAAAAGTLGWWRYEADSTDDQGASTAFRRIDGTAGTAGTDMIVGSTAVAAGATQTITGFTLTVPESD